VVVSFRGIPLRLNPVLAFPSYQCYLTLPPSCSNCRRVLALRERTRLVVVGAGPGQMLVCASVARGASCLVLGLVQEMVVGTGGRSSGGCEVVVVGVGVGQVVVANIESGRG
jgi:hypothetical protein